MSNRYYLLENRAVLILTGTDVRRFLQGIITQDIDLLTQEISLCSALLNAQGKYMYDFFLLTNGEEIWLDCDAARAQSLMQLLLRYRLRADVHLCRAPMHVLAVMGDLAALGLPEVHGRTEWHENGTIAALVDPMMAALGARVIAPENEAEIWVQQRGFAQGVHYDYERLRIENGIPESTKDSIPEKTLILENGFEELHGVSFTKGCYVGQEVTARTKHRAQLHKRLYIVRCDELGDVLPASGTVIVADGKEIGELRSTCDDVGIAIVRCDAVEGGKRLYAGVIPISTENPKWRS